MMESRIIEYPRPGGGLDYHSSPLLGEIPTSDYSYYRSIDQLRTTINERDVLQTIATSTPLQSHVTAATTTPSTTDLRAIEFSHKSFMSSTERRMEANNNGEMHHQLHHQQQAHPNHHENQSNKHQQHHNNNNHNLMDDRANNNVQQHSFSTHNAAASTNEIKTKSYRKNRKHNRNASANNSYNNNISSSSTSSSSSAAAVVVPSSLLHQQNNNYHQTQQQQHHQPYQQLQQQQHQSASNDQMSPHSHNADHPEASDEMIAGPVTGQTKEMKVGKSCSSIVQSTHVLQREIERKVEKIYKCVKFLIIVPFNS